ncbi:MAG TPA: MFS transporter [Candidatus Paceibacterota bacterium]|nr:MFS transporter [Candidatus Paceibacterota bacterium]
MSILLRKFRGIPRTTGIARLAIVGFIVSFASALISTIWAVYMDSFLKSIVLVGFISALLTLVSFIAYFLFIPLIEKKSKSKIFFFTLILFAVAYVLFAINTKFYLFIILAFLITILMALRTTSFGIIVKDKSSEKQLSRNEGLMYTFMNIAWVIGPLIAGYISSSFGIGIIFTLSAIFILIAALFFKLSKISDANIKKKADTNIIKNFTDFFKNKDRVYAYIVGGGVSLWWVLIYLFVPLYMIRNGLNILWIGYFLFAIAIPLIIFEFFFSKLAGKIGFKKIFKIGFVIPAILAIACFFISNIYVILALLVLASIGLAMLEPTTEAYFFDITKKQDESRFYGPYNTTIEVHNFLGKIISVGLLLILPFKYIFLLFGLLMLFFVFISFITKEVIEKRKRK